MPERPALEAVVFDAGGTLVRLDFEWMAQAVSGLDGALDAATLRRAEIEGRRRYDASADRQEHVAGPDPPLGGHGDIRAYFMGMLEAAGVTPGVRDAAYERFHVRQLEAGLWTRPMEGARAAIDGVAALGLRCAVVSNSDGRAEWHLEHTGTREGLEFVIDSAIVGVEKPDPRIFQIALDRLGCRRDEVVMVGDSWPADVAGAIAAGIRPIWFNPLRKPRPEPSIAVDEIHALEPIEDALRVIFKG